MRGETTKFINPLNAELNPICHLLALLGDLTIVVVSRLRTNAINFKVNIMVHLRISCGSSGAIENNH
jgi:hypothetical protein